MSNKIIDRVKTRDILKESHTPFFTMMEIDAYTDNLVGKVLTFLESIISNEKQLRSAKSVVKDYMYESNARMRSYLQEYADIGLGNPPYPPSLMDSNTAEEIREKRNLIFNK